MPTTSAYRRREKRHDGLDLQAFIHWRFWWRRRQTPARLREMKRTANGTISGGDAPVHKSAVPLKTIGRDGKLLISHKGKRDAEKACVVWDRANASRTVCRTHHMKTMKLL
ncbi:hypothetical protein EVAR_98115_1 [Eumeta japonica]|uniref:Uncharacterized protein n=1 Tax=Eumeta variegata TaxID=151549 RepID=A0A4C2A5W8_EUMVA|nr:hypothetical protein EVAR_98115_1 [Eumeta japonica]